MKIKEAGKILNVSETIRSLLDELDNTPINDDEKLRNIIGGIKTQSDSVFALITGLTIAEAQRTPRRMIYGVESSNIQSVEFDDRPQPNVDSPKVELIINFISGASYKYSDVPLYLAQDLLSASSAGSFYHREIRGNYTSEKVR
jgi:hypothetical protein